VSNWNTERGLLALRAHYIPVGGQEKETGRVSKTEKDTDKISKWEAMASAVAGSLL